MPLLLLLSIPLVWEILYETKLSAAFKSKWLMHFKSLRRGDNRKGSVSTIESKSPIKSIASVLILVEQGMQSSPELPAAGNLQTWVLSFFLFAALCGWSCKLKWTWLPGVSFTYFWTASFYLLPKKKLKLRN